MAADGVKIQLNLKTAKQGLHNIYAETVDEAVAQLAEFREKLIPELAATEELLWGASNAAPLTLPQQTPPPIQFPQQPAAAPAAGGPSCVHGAYVWKDFVSKAGRPIKGWFCPSPDRTDCKPSFK